MTTTRKIIQIAAIPETAYCRCSVFALADDGTIWSHHPGKDGTSWTQLKVDPLLEREE